MNRILTFVRQLFRGRAQSEYTLGIQQEMLDREADSAFYGQQQKQLHLLHNQGHCDKSWCPWCNPQPERDYGPIPF